MYRCGFVTPIQAVRDDLRGKVKGDISCYSTVYRQNTRGEKKLGFSYGSLGLAMLCKTALLYAPYPRSRYIVSFITDNETPWVYAPSSYLIPPS
jgi:hypothetical protein